MVPSEQTKRRREENYINLSPHALAPVCTSARLIKANDHRKSAVSSRPHENTPPTLQHDSNPASPTKAEARGLASLQLETLVTTKGTLFHAHPSHPPSLTLSSPMELNEALRKNPPKAFNSHRRCFFFFFCKVAGGCAFRVSDLADQTRQPPEITAVIYAAAARRKHLWKCDPSSALMHLMMIYAASRERKKGGKWQKKKGKRGNASSSPPSYSGCGDVVCKKKKNDRRNKADEATFTN